MSRGINKAILVGNCGDDPTVRYMPNGNAVANVTLATSENYKDKNTNQPVEKTEWHRVVFFGKLAEIVGEYARKGSQVYIEGKLQTRKWTDQQGVEKYTTEIVVDSFTGVMQMLGSRRTNDQDQAQGNQGNNNYQGQQNNHAQGNNQGQAQGNNSHGNSNNNYQGNSQAQRQGNGQAQRQNSQGQQQGGQAQQGVSNSQYMNGGQQQGTAGNPMGPGNDFYDDDIPFAPIGLQYPALLMCM